MNKLKIFTIVCALVVIIIVSSLSYSGMANRFGFTPNNLDPQMQQPVINQCKNVSTLDKNIPSFDLQNPQDFTNSKDNQEVKLVVDLAHDYAKALINRSYKTVNGDEEYNFYTLLYYQQLQANNNQQLIIKQFKENKLNQQLDGFKVLKVMFSNDFAAGQVDYSVTYHFVSASDDYLTRYKVHLNSQITELVKIKLVKENGTWKVNDKWQQNTI